MKSLIEKPRPGEFRAVCRKSEWVPLADVLALPTEAQPDTATSRWDHKLRCEVVAVACSFETDDREAYVEHMKTVHNGGCKVRLSVAPLKMWRYPAPGMGLKPEGQPFKPSTQALAKDVRTCASCGLVAEVGERAADVLWWAEHERMCTGEAAGSAVA